VNQEGEDKQVGKAGFCYVADCEAYIDEAMQSIASLRAQMPDVPVAIVTQRHLFRDEPSVTDWVEIQQARKGPIVKTDARLAPYERVIFLDSDTLIIDDLTGIFELLENFDFACAHEPNGHPEYGLESGVPRVFLEPNTGVFAFRKSRATEQLFENWLAEYDALHEKIGVANDQPSLRIALWKTDSVRHLGLAREYNLITHANCSVSGRVAVIHDRSRERFRLARTINRRIVPRAIVSGYGPVYGFGGRRGWVRQHISLTYEFLRMLARPGSLRQEGFPVVWWRDGID
jgi:hypothetical protein